MSVALVSCHTITVVLFVSMPSFIASAGITGFLSIKVRVRRAQRICCTCQVVLVSDRLLSERSTATVKHDFTAAMFQKLLRITIVKSHDGRPTTWIECCQSVHHHGVTCIVKRMVSERLEPSPAVHLDNFAQKVIGFYDLIVVGVDLLVSIADQVPGLHSSFLYNVMSVR